MLIKKIARLVKQYKHLGLATVQSDGGETRWAGNAGGYYNITDLPPLTLGACLIMLDLAASADKLEIEDESDGAQVRLTEAMCSADAVGGEKVDITKTYIGDSSLVVAAATDVNGERRYAFVWSDSLAPVPDTAYTTYELRRGKTGDMYLAVYEGIDIVAIIPSTPLPLSLIESWRQEQAAVSDAMDSYYIETAERRR